MELLNWSFNWICNRCSWWKRMWGWPISCWFFTWIEKQPFKCWENYHHSYPVLAHLVKNYLSAPPTSVNSKRVFSKGVKYTVIEKINCCLNLVRKCSLLSIIFHWLGRHTYKYWYLITVCIWLYVYGAYLRYSSAAR